jgi:hypothetical protein
MICETPDIVISPENTTPRDSVCLEKEHTLTPQDHVYYKLHQKTGNFTKDGTQTQIMDHKTFSNLSVRTTVSLGASSPEPEQHLTRKISGISMVSSHPDSEYISHEELDDLDDPIHYTINENPLNLHTTHGVHQQLKSPENSKEK